MNQRRSLIPSLTLLPLVLAGLLLLALRPAPVATKTDQVANSERPAQLKQPANEFIPEEGENNEERRRQWIEDLHRCSPAVDWQQVNRMNAQMFSNLRPKAKGRGATGESFANGQVQGTWSDRGSVNQSGSMDAICYVPGTNQIYAFGGELSSTIGGRSLWRGNLDGTGWTVLNDDYTIRADMLEAIIPSSSSSVRLIASGAKELTYSDDEGQTWLSPTMNPEMGYDGFGRRMKIKKLPNDNDVLFYLVRTWDADPWAYRCWLYRSTDAGLSFDRIEVFTESNRRKVDLWAPESGGSVYVLENSTTLYSYTGTTQNSVNCSGLPSGRNEYQLTGSLAGGLTMYCLVDGEDIYKSTNGGSNWTFVSTAPINAWDVGMTCSPSNSDVLVIGGVNSYVSQNGGSSWNLVNEWWEYYDNIDLLHADMMEFEWGQTAAGADFLMIGNHGGIHVSYDEMATTTNISKLGLNVCMYYDVLTHPTMTNVVFLGAQDQGFQWTDTANNPGPMTVVQQISGDYGQLHLTRDNQSYWQQYPGAWFTYYHDVLDTTSYQNSFNLDGSNLPSWIVPTGKIRSDESENAILVGGGALNGGSGSYLIKLTRSAQNGITGSQYNYNFLANSNNGGARISAIEQPEHDSDTIYVTTNDGTFFRTTNGGNSWQKTNGFQVANSTWIYTSTILASRTNTDVIWTSGSGYSNPPVFKSDDGGTTFSPMSNGLPDTLVQEIVANPDETLLFAATDAGPFVYVVADDQWYPMIGAITPINWFTSVEYVEQLDTVRFATMGRGVWDFKIDMGAAIVCPDNMTVSAGDLDSGTVSDLCESNDNKVVVDSPATTLSNTIVECVLTGSSPTTSPASLKLIVEASTGRQLFPVNQTIKMFNYATNSYEIVDVRLARINTDLVVEVEPTGDLSRFVDPNTDEIKVSVSYGRQRGFNIVMQARIDQVIWEIE